MDQPDDRRDDHRKEAHGVTIVLPHDLKPFEPANPVLDVHPHLGQVPIRFALRLRQCAPAGLPLRRLDAIRTQIAQIGLILIQASSAALCGGKVAVPNNPPQRRTPG